MDTDFLLSHLDKVRPAGDREWMACCPAHDDKSPSLRVTDRGDRLLIHCYAGCDPHIILAHIGLKWGNLFADQKKEHWAPPRMRLDPLTIEYDEAKLTLQMAQNRRESGEHLNGYELLQEKEAGDRLSKHLGGGN